MLNIKDLEKRWFRYKIKSYLPYITIFISLCFVIALGAVILNKKQDTKIDNLKKVAIKKEVLKIKKDPHVSKKIAIIIKKPTTIKKKIAIKTIKLKPSLGFMKKIENSVQPYYEDNANIDTKSIKQQMQQKQEINDKQKNPKKKITTVKNTPKKSTNKIQIKIRNTNNDIQDVIKRFRKNNKPALSLFIAKKEYEIANYNQAYNYALITNKLNSNIEESWIIFAKSLVKLGKKNQAISTLKEYIKYSNSSNAQVLLNEILSGKFI